MRIRWLLSLSGLLVACSSVGTAQMGVDAAAGFSGGGGSHTGTGGSASGSGGAGAGGAATGMGVGGTPSGSGGAVSGSGGVGSGGAGRGGAVAGGGGAGSGGQTGRGGAVSGSGGVGSGGTSTGSGGVGGGTSTSSCSAVSGGPNGSGTWKMVWQDEFDGASGASPDATKWVNPTNDNSCTVSSQQLAAFAASNAYLDGNGHLVIKAEKKTTTGCSYTSGQISTQKLFTQAYGRWEFCAQMPAGGTGSGMWPALWMYPWGVSWPPEIDVLEDVNDMSTVYFTYHWSTSNQTDGATYKNAALATGYHQYAVEWEPGQITWLVDGTVHKTISGSNVTSMAMSILIDIYVGGDWPGNPTSAAIFPQYMYVDYVRVYQ
jgi:hypothetical protein